MVYPRNAIFLLSLAAHAGGVMADTDSEKGAFHAALSAMDPSASIFLFLTDEYLRVRCGQPPTLTQVRAVSGAQLPLERALWAGDMAQAHQVLAHLPCE